MLTVEKGILRELGPSITRDSIVEYRYIEFTDGKMLGPQVISSVMQAKLLQALNSNKAIELYIFDTWIIAVINVDDQTGYITKLEPEGASGRHKFVGWVFMIIGIATIPLLFMGLIIMYYAYNILQAAKVHEREELIAIEQQKLVLKFPKAQVLPDY